MDVFWGLVGARFQQIDDAEIEVHLIDSQIACRSDTRGYPEIEEELIEDMALTGFVDHGADFGEGQVSPLRCPVDGLLKPGDLYVFDNRHRGQVLRDGVVDRPARRVDDLLDRVRVQAALGGLAPVLPKMTVLDQLAPELLEFVLDFGAAYMAEAIPVIIDQRLRSRICRCTVVSSARCASQVSQISSSVGSVVSSISSGGEMMFATTSTASLRPRQDCGS